MGITNRLTIKKLIENRKTVSYELKLGKKIRWKSVEAIKAFDCHEYTVLQQKEQQSEAKISL